MDHWLNDVSKQQVQDTTWADYQLQSQKAVQALGTKPLKSLMALDFQGLYSQLISEGLSSRTVRYVHTVCRHALQDAVDFGLLPVNPTVKAKAPKMARSTIALPNPDQAQILLREADNHRQRALWYVIALTGLRRGEALGLQWGDIDWSTKTLTVQRNLVEKSHLGIRVHAPKTAQGHRMVALSSFMISILRNAPAMATGGTTCRGERLAGRPLDLRDTARHVDESAQCLSVSTITGKSMIGAHAYSCIASCHGHGVAQPRCTHQGRIGVGTCEHLYHAPDIWPSPPEYAGKCGRQNGCMVGGPERCSLSTRHPHECRKHTQQRRTTKTE